MLEIIGPSLVAEPYSGNSGAEAMQMKTDANKQWFTFVNNLGLNDATA
ncbi:hypothetical protein LG204_01840 [Methylovorus menthalis]|nr:hypothetical protein [Methylovorus menthalis]MCB4810054.1 hypothetical protein [Methylovorus menthalis]